MSKTRSTSQTGSLQKPKPPSQPSSNGKLRSETPSAHSGREFEQPKTARPTKLVPKYYLVTAPPDEPPTCQEFAELEALRKAVMTMTPRDETYVFVFVGGRMLFTGGEYRYLLPPGRDPVPLFHIPSADEMNVSLDGHFAPNKLALKPSEAVADDSPPEAEAVDAAFAEDADSSPADVYGGEPQSLSPGSQLAAAADQ